MQNPPRLGPRGLAALAVGLVALGVTARLLPHPPNFTPAASIALFAGFVFPNPVHAIGVVLALMLASDWFVGFYEPAVMAAVYLGLALPIALRIPLRARPSAWRIAGAASACSLAFFALTNLAVWSVWYEPTWAGLVECYTFALPFLKYTLLGDMTWSLGLFTAYAVVVGWAGARKPALEVSAT